MKSISVIVATAQNGGIGKDGNLPWRIPEDLAHFKRVTTARPKGDGASGSNAVIMGRKTWDSIPAKFRPLAGRVNVVLTKAASEPGFASPYPEGVLVASSVKAAAEELSAREDVGEIFVIGGQAAYEEAIGMPCCDRLFITRVGKDVDCDAFFPAFDVRAYEVVHVSQTRSHEGTPYDFMVYERLEASRGGPLPSLDAAGGAGQFLHEEYKYLEAIREIIEKGVPMEDRTGVGTLSMFGRQMRFDLRTTFPLLTTKRTFWRGVVEELLWFVRGDTNAKHLTEKGVKIWDANGSREFLDKRGLVHREEGDLGPVYGFQWRHFGAKYVDMHTDYKGQGVDQLAECIKKIKEDPTDRRILLSAWNPADLSQMALPPCHMFCQFYVANGELSCLMYQRSCDMGLGVPFNIASYSLLTCMVAQVCGLKPGDFVHTMGNAHVYKNHVEPLKTQLERTPRPFPVLRTNPDVKDIDGFQASDFELLGYNPHGKIAMEMAV
uniref:Bifunctional dihydrofolate reductase-thymidylate synthase n=1 Tax=Alexandrium catenella TaxID=2925 RepID=A0A7S1KUV1_ALECA